MYLSVLPSDLRMYLCKFRCLSNNLPIETGRFFNIDRSERYCNLCNVNELGDEFHYLFKCTFFSNVRANCLPRNRCNNPKLKNLPVSMGKLLLRQRNLHKYILRSDGNTDKYCSKQKLDLHILWKWSCSNPITDYFPGLWKHGQFTSGHIGHTKMPLFDNIIIPVLYKLITQTFLDMFTNIIRFSNSLIIPHHI
jgi:hypothetical protein